MKNLYCLLILFLGFPIIVFSQKYEVSWSKYNKESPKFRDGVGNSNFQILKKEKDFFYGVVQNNNNSVLHQINYEGKILKSEAYRPSFRNKGNSDFRYFQTTSGIFRTESIRNLQKKEWMVYATPINENLTGEKTLQTNYQLPDGQKFTDQKKWIRRASWKNSDLNFSISPDSNKVAFGNLLVRTSKKQGKDKYAVLIFDENMKLVNEYTYSLPYNALKELKPHQMVVDNNGTIYLLAKYQNYQLKSAPIFKVFIITKQATKEIDIVLEDNLLPSNAAVFFLESSNSVVLTGFYEQAKNIAGTYYAKFSIDDTPITKTHPFDKEFLDYVKQNQSKLKPLLAKRHSIRESRMFPNGDYQFITEFFRCSQGQASHTPSEFQTGNIIITTIDNAGNRVDATKITRLLNTAPAYTKGFLTFIKDDKTHILYDTQLSTWKKTVKLLIIEPRSKLHKEVLMFNPQKTKVDFVSLSGFIMKNNQLFFGGSANKLIKGIYSYSILYFGTIDLN